MGMRLGIPHVHHLFGAAELSPGGRYRTIFRIYSNAVRQLREVTTQSSLDNCSKPRNDYSKRGADRNDHSNQLIAHSPGRDAHQPLQAFVWSRTHPMPTRRRNSLYAIGPGISFELHFEFPAYRIVAPARVPCSRATIRPHSRSTGILDHRMFPFGMIRIPKERIEWRIVSLWISSRSSVAAARSECSRVGE